MIKEESHEDEKDRVKREYGLNPFEESAASNLKKTGESISGAMGGPSYTTAHGKTTGSAKITSPSKNKA